MRLFLCLMIAASPVTATAQAVSGSSAEHDTPAALFSLGGSASSGPVTGIDSPRVESVSFLRYPEISPLVAGDNRTATGGVTVFGTDSVVPGEEVFRLGSAYSRGAATAGIAVTYSGEAPRPDRSDIFVDYALTERVSVGVSGLLAAPRPGGESVTRLGVNAAFLGAEGSYLAGSIGQSGADRTFVGLSIGLRF